MKRHKVTTTVTAQRIHQW